MNTETLLKYLQDEIKVINGQAYKYSTTDDESAMKSNCRVLENIAKRTHTLENVLSCVGKSATEVIAMEIPQTDKQIVLEMFDQTNLIAEMLKK